MCIILCTHSMVCIHLCTTILPSLPAGNTPLQAQQTASGIPRHPDHEHVMFSSLQWRHLQHNAQSYLHTNISAVWCLASSIFFNFYFLFRVLISLPVWSNIAVSSSSVKQTREAESLLCFAEYRNQTLQQIFCPDSLNSSIQLKGANQPGHKSTARYIMLSCIGGTSPLKHNACNSIVGVNIQNTWRQNLKISSSIAYHWPIPTSSVSQEWNLLLWVGVHKCMKKCSYCTHHCSHCALNCTTHIK